MDDTLPRGPLAGVRIVDLTTVLMGPYATQILGDYGADVIKVEAPGGDNVRGIGPARHPGMGSPFLQVNRNKRSVVLDLKQAQGRDALLRLVATADVLLYNVRPQAMARLGLSYEEIASINPDIIYAGVYGYGQGGPYAAKPAYDDLIQGATGFPALSVRAGSDEPVYVPTPIADRFVGVAAVGAVTAALFHRERTGEGQSIEIPMFETMAQLVLSDHMYGHGFVPAVGDTGYPRVLNEHRKPYRTRDGYLCVLLYNDRHWRDFFRLIGQPEVMDSDPRFSTIGKRTENIHALYAMVAEVMATRTTTQWLEALNGIDVPVMPMHSVESLMEDPHLKAVGFLQTVEHPTEGAIVQMAVPSTWSKTQPGVRRQAPRAGEQGRELLDELGYAPEEIEAMAAAGITQFPLQS
ncbi:CaiB/BaiF CoA-transferase family protein [Variovorax sp. Sphag1AA]|uniref:CaiB/BaiF CoA transferase family protein n=1 Tax=Variovorax sp. Sphag1AA TaxID=2587027 RepID=UPI00160A145D|nr:CoA transferase [Variovorax sp. Sphag1AA]MBB3181613.1 crotonobetainyl-CoA:carnitine CoA-transferase CaiB-like acyl-CoA transferase [Variovorax sp. Sphag1AA]